MTSERDRALRLIEREDKEVARRAEQEDHEARESRIKDAQRRIRELDLKAKRERRRADTLDRAEQLEPGIIAKQREADDALAALARSVNELEALHDRYRTLLREAGEPLPQPIRKELTWWLYSHLGTLTELDREQRARLTLRGEPAPFSLSDGTE